MAAARIIKLADYRRPTQPVGGGGFEFPTLYRLTGFFGAVPADIDDPTASDEEQGDPSPPLYTLDPTEDEGLINPIWTPLSAPDPAIDTGWIILRHHSSLERALGYQMGLLDAAEPTSHHQNIFETALGVFTVHRAPYPSGSTTPLLVFARHKPHRQIGEVEEKLAVRSDGSTFDPDDIELDP